MLWTAIDALTIQLILGRLPSTPSCRSTIKEDIKMEATDRFASVCRETLAEETTSVYRHQCTCHAPELYLQSRTSRETYWRIASNNPKP